MALAETGQNLIQQREELRENLSLGKDIRKICAFLGTSFQVGFAYASSTLNPEILEKADTATKSLEVFISSMPTIIFFGVIAYMKLHERDLQRQFNDLPRADLSN